MMNEFTLYKLLIQENLPNMSEKTFNYSESELIAFVKGTLSAELSQQIAAEIKKNSDLAEAVSLHAHLNMIQQYPTLLDDLAQLKTQNAQAKVGRQLKTTFVKAAAAAIAIISLLGTSTWLYTKHQTTLKKEKASSFTKLFLNTKSDRYVHGNLEKETNKLLSEALTYYVNKDYFLAEKALMPIYTRAEQAEAGELGIYIATCRLRTGKYEAAKTILNAILEANHPAEDSDKDENLINAVYWHLALAALGEGEWQTAKHWLNKIPIENDDYSIPAKEMLQQMERKPL